jgi:ureidoglycolate lyase/2,4-diketo-3-deoxy-L-fuconate hydrolase
MAIPSEPPLFFKPSSAIIGPNDDVEIPLGSEKTDWEVELGVVIGSPGKYLRVDQALDHVAGYCIVNDVLSTFIFESNDRKLMIDIVRSAA